MARESHEAPSPERSETLAAEESPAERLRSLEALLARSAAEGMPAEPGVLMLLDRLREVIDAVEQFEATLGDERPKE